MNSKNECQNLSLLEQALLYKLYLEQNAAKSKLKADKLVVLDKALELYRLSGSISQAALNFGEFPNNFEECILKAVFKDDIAALSRVLFKSCYRPRSSFLATDSAVGYISDFPSSPASMFLGGRPFKSDVQQGFTPAINIHGLVKDINSCVPAASSTFHLTSASGI